MSETNEDNRYPYPDDMPTDEEKAACVQRLRDLSRTLDTLAQRMEEDDYDAEALSLTGVVVALCAPVSPLENPAEGSHFTNMVGATLNDRDKDGDRHLGGMSACVGYTFPQGVAVKNAVQTRPALAGALFGPFAQFMGFGD